MNKRKSHRLHCAAGTKAWKLLLERARMPGIAKTLSSYMLYDETKARFFFHSKQSQGFSSLEQMTAIAYLVLAVTECNCEHEHVYNLSDKIDAAMPSVTYNMFERFEYIILNHDTYESIELA